MSRECNLYYPENYGWLTASLSEEEMVYLWKIVNTSGRKEEHRMASQTDGCYQLFDEYDYFFENVLLKLASAYESNYGTTLRQLPTGTNDELYLDGIWVNYQKQNEFFPIHTHNGIYSFVVWMKIPTHFEDQIKDKPKVDKVLFNGLYTSDFVFNYSDLLGTNRTFEFKMSPEMEGTILFFPSKLQHAVYPFYNCDEERVSVSGNLCIK